MQLFFRLLLLLPQADPPIKDLDVTAGRSGLLRFFLLLLSVIIAISFFLARQRTLKAS